jgi:lysophospholipase
VTFKNYTKVLVIVTGGTLTMVNTDQGYVSRAGLAQRLKKQIVFYDKEHAKAVGLEDDWLVTPCTLYGKRIKFKVLELEKLLDSSNIEISDQLEIAKLIQTNYREYDGFVIVHGTDTMAYTASVLSFVLENLNKTVVLTGSQIPISELRNDAVDNLLGALLVAGPYLIPEVVLFFGNKLFRGNRCTKEDSYNIEAFNSPNIEPLAKFGVNFEIDWDRILPHSNQPL